MKWNFLSLSSCRWLVQTCSTFSMKRPVLRPVRPPRLKDSIFAPAFSIFPRFLWHTIARPGSSSAVWCCRGNAIQQAEIDRSKRVNRDRGWFFKPQRFATKLTLLKKETLQLSNATNFSSIRQETTKLQEFKVERFANKFVTVTTGKDPVRRHKRLEFPPWQRFICI